jgi:hypothetical protein
MRILSLSVIFASLVLAQPQATVGGCPAFPANNIWNTRVDTLPLLPTSAAIVASIGTTAPLRLDDTMPINIVPGSTPDQAVPRASGEDDPGMYKFPVNAVLENGEDSHLIVVDKDNCILYEAYFAKLTNGLWTVGSKAKWDLRSNALRPDGWTSSDAAGLPVAPGVLRYDEVAAGSVDHALRFTAPATFAYAYTWPARHYASHNTTANLPMMGQRLRLRASFDISSFSPRMQVILQGMKRYGIMLADNGMPFGMQHDQDPRWDPAEVVTLHNVLGSNMEVVDTAQFISDYNQGIAQVPPPPSFFMTDTLGRLNSVPVGAGFSNAAGALSVVSTSGGAVQSVAGRTGAVTLGVNDILGLSTALAAKQNALGFVPERSLTFSAPLTRSGDTVVCTNCVTTGPKSGSGSPANGVSGSGAAAFLKKDTTTLGNWKGVYGSLGYQLAGLPARLPANVSMALVGTPTISTWASSTSDVRALRLPDSQSLGIAATWVSTTALSFDVNFADTAAHQISLYCLDWDSASKAERIEVLDVANTVLDSRDLTLAGTGTYLTWSVSGHVIIRITPSKDAKAAVLSGVFVD